MSDMLFDIPASNPPLSIIGRIKATYEIETYRFADMAPEDGNWAAFQRDDDDHDLPVVEALCRTVESDGACYAASEEDAVMEYCKRYELSIKLSDLA